MNHYNTFQSSKFDKPDNSTDSKFQMVKSESIGDYDVEYESLLDQLNQELLNPADKSILSKYKKQFFTSAGILD